jgi:polyphosphate kinase 2 (PPK2 family)
MAGWEFLSSQTYHLVLQGVPAAGKLGVTAAVIDAIDPRVLHGVARPPFCGDRSEEGFADSSHGMASEI